MFSEDLSELHDPIAAIYWRRGRLFLYFAMLCGAILIMALVASYGHLVAEWME